MRATRNGGPPAVQLHLDYLSCLLTIVATILVGRKSWTGLAISGINSMIICVIGLRTGQLGFIPANVFCMGIYGVSIRSWLKEENSRIEPAAETCAASGNDLPEMGSIVNAA